MFDVFPLFAATLRPQFLRTVSILEDKKAFVFSISKVTLFPYCQFELIFRRGIEITSSVSDVVSAVRVGGAREGKLLPRRR